MEKGNNFCSQNCETVRTNSTEPWEFKRMTYNFLISVCGYLEVPFVDMNGTKTWRDGHVFQEFYLVRYWHGNIK